MQYHHSMPAEEPVPGLTVVVGRVPEGTPLVETNTGLRVPGEFWAAVHDDAKPDLVWHVTVAIRDDGVPEFRGIRTSIRPGASFTDERLPRKAWVLEKAVEGAAEPEMTEVAVTRPPRGTRRVFTPALLNEIADVVRDAETRGVPVRRTVADRFRIPEMTARNWINKAREPGGPLYTEKKEQS